MIVKSIYEIEYDLNGDDYIDEDKCFLLYMHESSIQKTHEFAGWLDEYFNEIDNKFDDIEKIDEYLKKSKYSVSGFSLGAERAFEYVLNSTDRIDTLQLFSPAFFQENSEKFKRLQTISYQKNQEAYEKQFLENIAYPSTYKMQQFFKKDSVDSLQKLLEFKWDVSQLEELKNRGTKIEVYLGGEDKIINSKKAYDFFKNYATVYFIKEGGHILWTK